MGSESIHSRQADRAFEERGRALKSEREAKLLVGAVWAIAFMIVAVFGMFLFFLAVLVNGWPQ